METKTSAFNASLVPGLLVSLTAVLLSLTTSLLIGDYEQQKTYGWLVWVAIVGLMVYFGIQYRTQQLDGQMTYKQGFKFLFFVNLINAFFFSIYNYVYMAFIDPDMIVKIQEQAAEKLAENPDLSQAQIDQAIEMQSKFMSLPFMTITTFISSILVGVLLALILAAFLKNAKAESSFEKDLS